MADEKRVGPVAQIHRLPGTSLPKHTHKIVAIDEPEGQAPAAAGPDRYCVYNETQQRFVSTDVLVGDSCDDPGSQGASWIVPFQEISPSSVRFPVDLVILSDACIVMHTVESFPISPAPSSGTVAASMLVFPADRLARGEILPGDQLIISTPEEMKQQLRRLQLAKGRASGDSASNLRQPLRLNTDQQSSIATETEVERAAEFDRNEPSPEDPDPASAEEHSGAPASTVIEPAKQQVAELPWARRLGSRNWFQRLLLGDRPDPRNGPRAVVPGLVAYYFTGGTPMPNEVRDISTSGLFLFTNERWCLGTLVRLTLTRRDDPRADRSLTVIAKVARRENEGVGLEFILDGDSRPKEIHLGPDQTYGVDVNRVQLFLDTLQPC